MSENDRRAVGDELRRQQRTRCRLQGRALIVGGLIAAVATTIIVPATPRLVWNASASAPIGLYAVAPKTAVRIGDMVVARLPPSWRGFADARRYVPAGVPLIKHIAAAAGDRVCARGDAILVNGRALAKRRRFDAAGRVMPAWSGCMTLSNKTLFLLNDHPLSFDGRYFGASATWDIVGTAYPLWTR